MRIALFAFILLLLGVVNSCSSVDKVLNCCNDKDCTGVRCTKGCNMVCCGPQMKALYNPVCQTLLTDTLKIKSERDECERVKLTGTATLTAELTKLKTLNAESQNNLQKSKQTHEQCEKDKASLITQLTQSKALNTDYQNKFQIMNKTQTQLEQCQKNITNLTIELAEAKELISQYKKINEEREKERNEISKIQYTSKYVETEKAFIENGTQQDLSSQTVQAAITYVGYRVIPNNMNFKLLSTPEKGFINGTVRMLQPDGREETINFKNELGYRAFARITELTSNKVVLEDYLYYRLACFNPLRTALNITTDVTFTPFLDGKISVSAEKIYMSSKASQFIDTAKIVLKEKNKQFQVFSLRTTGFSKKRANELANDVILQKECEIVLGWLFPLERLRIESFVRKAFIGKAHILQANGELQEKNFDGEVVIEVTTSGGRMNKYLLTIPTLQLIILKETFSFQLENLKPFSNIISASRKQIENSCTNPTGKEFDLVPPKYLANKTIAVFVGWNTTGEIVFAQKQRNWLEDQGLIIKATTNESEFLEYLKVQPSLIWVISSPKMTNLTIALVEKVVELHRRGSALWVWAENDPFYVEANLILQKIMGDPTFQLTGSYGAMKTLNPKKDGLVRGAYDASNPVSTGLISLYEGHTIAYPNKNFPAASGFQVYAYNSNPSANQAAIFYRPPKGKEGAVWVDTGYTKIFSQPEYDEETRRYLANVNAYLIDYTEIAITTTVSKNGVYLIDPYSNGTLSKEPLPEFNTMNFLGFE